MCPATECLTGELRRSSSSAESSADPVSSASPVLSVAFCSLACLATTTATTTATPQTAPHAARIVVLCFPYQFFVFSTKEVGSPSSEVGSLGVESFTRTHLPDPSLSCQAIT